MTTRDELLAAAAEVFERDGYVRATVDDVCLRVGVTKGALYGHFSSKKALAVALVEAHALDWARARERLLRVHRSPLQVLVDLGYAAEHAAVRRLLFQSPVCDEVAERQVAQWRSTVHDLLRGAAARGELRADADLPASTEGIVSELVGVHLVAMAVDAADAAARGLDRVWRSWLPAIVRPEVWARLRLGPPR
ncbi:TetR/AcrR family transcriptional regulator [Saccharothrix syringae]|uniref:TetR/AcrR family transcriptional regulator n=1 Tax=Saccharothrix syringae TaxID=103733 RepID=UPI00068E96C1|nr:TetR/AcrR family transcriptional regulator [Saccharothrix syringae]